MFSGGHQASVLFSDGHQVSGVFSDGHQVSRVFSDGRPSIMTETSLNAPWIGAPKKYSQAITF